MSQLHFCAIFPSPLGDLVLTANREALTGLYLPEHELYEEAKLGIESPEMFQEAFEQLGQYFAGRRRRFELVAELGGTEFETLVWKALCEVPYGQTRTYKQMAEEVKSPQAGRAIGGACAKNPLSIIIPCHRVIASNGNLSGYSGGDNAKLWLLKHEAMHSDQGAY